MDSKKQHIFLKLKDSQILLIMGVLALVCYYETLYTNFVSDDFTFLYECKTIGLGLFSKNFNEPFFLPFKHWFQYAEFICFGINTIGYHLIAILIHTLNAWLIYLIIQKISHKIHFFINETSLIISLLFLVCPYQTEAVVWFSSISYLLGTLFLLLSILFFIKTKVYLKKTDFALSILFYFFSLLSKEIALGAPLMIILYELFFDKSTSKLKFKIIGAFIGVTLLYFLLRYYTLGTFVGGYGASTHLNFNISLLTQNTVAYLAKFILGYRYLPECISDLFSIIYQSKILITLLITTVIGAIIFIIKKKLIDGYKTKVVIFLFILFIISLLPVINLETSFLGDVQSDRYGYLPSVLFYVFLVFTTYIFFNVVVNKIVYSITILYFMYNVIQTNKLWKTAGNITTTIINEFKNTSLSDDIYVLNIPDNYNGVYVFRTSFSSAIKLYNPNIKEKNIHIISWQNITSNNEVIKINYSNDSLYINTIDDKNYLMRYNQELIDIVISNDILNFNKNGFTLKKSTLAIPHSQFYIFNKGILQRLDPQLFNQ